MSSLDYKTYPGMGQALSDRNHYSQSVRLPGNPARVLISGQGGWDNEKLEIIKPTSPEQLRKQVDQAFANVELTLKTSGSKGWSDVYLVRGYYVVDGDAGEGVGKTWNEQREFMVELGGDAMRKWCPNHRPLLTFVEVKGLAAEGMKLEVEVEALLDE